MISPNRLIRVESSLTPKQAVLRWLQDRQGNTWTEYTLRMFNLPRQEAPRQRVESQVLEAIRRGMKGQEPSSINRALRQARMYTDFLILLVSVTNTFVLEQSRSRCLEILLCQTELRNAVLSRRKNLNEWIEFTSKFASEAASVQAAVELIKQEHFSNQEILFKDIREDLQQQTAALHNFVDVYRRLMTQNRRKLPPCVADFQENVSKQAVQTATQLVAQAKFKMLDDFGETEAADAVIRPYLLGN